MFGMALKFIQLNLQPLGIFKTEKSQPQTQQIIKQVKSENQINAQQVQKIKQTSQDYQLQNYAIQKQQNKDQSQRMKDQNNINQIKQSLKKSQIKILEDFKNSLIKSFEQNPTNQNKNDQKFGSDNNYNHLNYQQEYRQKNQYQNQNQQTNKAESYNHFNHEKFLSKIQQLSQEYLQYSIKQSNFNAIGKQGQSYAYSQKNKASSCQLIKSIVKSIILPGQNSPISQSQLRFIQKSPQVYEYCSQQLQQKRSLQKNNLQTSETNRNSFEVIQPTRQFIRQLFQSLGLINEQQKQNGSLSKISSIAKSNFSKLKGNDYVQKLNSMLQSIQNLNKSGFKDNAPDNKVQAHKIIGSECMKQQGHPKKDHQISYGQEQAIKHDGILKYDNKNNRKVKIISPQTFSQINSKKALLQKQIQEALLFLSKPKKLKKYSFTSLDIKEIVLNFSLDFKFLSYKPLKNSIFNRINPYNLFKKICTCQESLDQDEIQFQQQIQGQQTIVSLSWNLVNVVKGMKTKNFIKYEDILDTDQNKSKDKQLENRCISLLFKDRTYDLECETTQIRDLLFKYVKLLIKSSSYN